MIQWICLDLARAEEGAIKSALILRNWARTSKDAWYKQEQALDSVRRKEVQERRAQLRALLPGAVYTARMLWAYEQLRPHQADPR